MLDELSKASSEDADHRFALVELIKLDMSLHGDGQSIPTTEEYLRDGPLGMVASDAPPDLILEEIQLRKDRREEIDYDSYVRLYPRCQNRM